VKAARYFERRFLHSALLLVGVSILTFTMAQLVPGNYLDELKLNPQISTQTIEALRLQYGLDQPVATRYFRWVKSVSTGDFGYSLAYNVHIRELLSERKRNTFLLGGTAMLLAWSLALPLGIWSAKFRGRWIDRVTTGTSLLLLGTPEPALCLLLILLASRTGILPTGGMSSIGASAASGLGSVIDILRHLVIPATALVLAALPVLLRHVRNSMCEALNAPSVQAARGYGISEFRLLIRHALPQAANPLISLFGLSLAGIFCGSLVVEVIMGWPGLGPLFLQSIFAHDFQVVLAIVMFSSALLSLANLTADMLLYAVDPRIRVK
jgi:peptide/nickel transport system permease protein